MLKINLLKVDLKDEYFMKLALEQAHTAYEKDEIPIGAVIVSQDNSLISCDYNQVEKDFSQNSHAEVKAIESAGKKLKNWRLDGCTIYSTLEPCLMCMSLIGLSRIERIVYGADSQLFGYHIDKEFLPGLYQKHIKGVTQGVLKNEALLLLKKFFQNKRKKGE